MKTGRRSFLAKISTLLLGSMASKSASADKTPSAQAQTANALDVGKVYLRGDSAYETHRRAAVWQAIKPERYPDLIAQAHTEADIVETINYAKAKKLPVSVCGGGHSYVGSPLRNGGILLDVSALRAVDITPATRVASVQPGIRSAEFSAMLETHALGFPIAHCPTVSLGGYLLGGGMGWNGGNWKELACFNVHAVDLITANGERIHANKKSHAELFWAARGAGPAFCAVATKFYLDLFPMPGAITSSTYIYTMDGLDSVIEWLEDYRSHQDPKIELTVIFVTDEEADSSAPDHGRQFIVSAVCFADNEEEAKQLLGEMAKGAPRMDRIHGNEYQSRSMQSLLAASKAVIPERHAVDTLWTGHTEKSLRVIAEHFMDAPSAGTHVFANFRATPKLTTDAAYSLIAPMFIISSTTWADTKDDAACLRWSDALMEKLNLYNEGAYINETDFMRYPERGRQCFTPTSLSRLKAVCEHYDPMGMFSSPFEL
jgi:FAD/FMN-containing dehydrogenase